MALQVDGQCRRCLPELCPSVQGGRLVPAYQLTTSTWPDCGGFRGSVSLQKFVQTLGPEKAPEDWCLSFQMLLYIALQHSSCDRGVA